MAQTPSSRWESEAGVIDYTPGSAVTAGDVVVIGSQVCVANQAIAANTAGQVSCHGTFKMPKVTGAISKGDTVFWAASGSPVTGDASSGAITKTASGNTRAGIAVAAALSGDSYAYVKLCEAVGTAGA